MTTRKNAIAAMDAEVTGMQVVEDLAVSMWGKAIKDPKYGQRTSKQYIGGLKPSNQTIANAEKVNLSPRTTIDFTKEEYDDSDKDFRYLVIGYAYPDIAKAEALAKNSTKHAVGIAKNPAVEIVDLEGKIPWIVVAPVGDTRGQQAPFLVLTEPTEDGLCQPLPIKKEFVFFFHEYRDASTGGDRRKTNWSNKVWADCGKSVSVTLTKKQKIYAAARSNAVGPVPPSINLATTMYANYLAWAENCDRRGLKVMLQDLQRVDKDVRLAPAAHNSSLRAFIDPEEEFGEDKAHDILRRFKLGDSVSAETVQQLRKVTVCANHFIENRVLTPWLQCCLKRLGKLGPMEDEAMKQYALEVREYAIDLLPRTEYEPISIEEDDKNALLMTIARQLRELSKRPSALAEYLRTKLGNTTYAEGTTHSAIWEKFANCRDTDAAKKLQTESLAFRDHLMLHEFALPLGEDIRDLAANVEKLAGARN